MQRYDRTHLIPIEDRKRELIAARHTARVRRLYGTIQSKQAASGEHSVLPVYLSADEVIGLIAYDRTTALSEPAPGAPPIFERWKSHLTGGSTDERQYPLVRDMRLVLSRVRWWQLRKRERAGPAKCPIKPLDQIARGHVRWALRCHQRTAVETIALLRSDVRQLLAAQTSHEIVIERATAILCNEIAAEHIVAFGRPGVWRTRRFKGGIHEPIPSVFFANPNNTIMADGWATCGWDATTQDWADWNGPEWGDVRFKRDDALSLIQRLFGPMTMQIDCGYISPLFATGGGQQGTATIFGGAGRMVSRAITPSERQTVGPGARTRLTIPNTPGGGGKKIAAATEAMVLAVQEGRVPFDMLRRMKQKELEGLYPEARRTTLTKSREAALAQLAAAGHSDKAPT